MGNNPISNFKNKNDNNNNNNNNHIDKIMIINK